jgi:hypothetical protein
MAPTSLPFEDVNFLLVYLPVDKSFLITHIDDAAWTEHEYGLLGILQKKVKLKVDYDESSFEGIVMQCAKEAEHLDGTQS